MEEKQTNWTVGEGYELPSKGLIYDKPVSSHVMLRSMNGREEMQRRAPSTTPLKILADIIEGCMIDKPAIHVYDMALGDYEFLLHRLRVVTYGPEYKVVVGCPYCGHTFETEINLDALDVKEFDQATFEELRTINLPVSGATVTLKLQTPRTLEESEARAKEYKRKFKGSEKDFTLLLTLTAGIDTVNGQKLNQFDLEAWIDKLPAKDLTKIANTLDKLNSCIGIDNKFFVDCEKCGGEVQSFFRFEPEFFRPTNI